MCMFCHRICNKRTWMIELYSGIRDVSSDPKEWSNFFYSLDTGIASGHFY